MRDNAVLTSHPEDEGDFGPLSKGPRHRPMRFVEDSDADGESEGDFG